MCVAVVLSCHTCRCGITGKARHYRTNSVRLIHCQPGFSMHSTETAVLKVLSDILLALDSGNLLILTLLDLSAPFDSVDHHTLLKRLHTSYGLGRQVINWFASYLCGRVQHVSISATSSTPSVVLYGIPQGSVLGPILFLLHTADLQSAACETPPADSSCIR